MISVMPREVAVRGFSVLIRKTIIYSRWGLLLQLAHRRVHIEHLRRNGAAIHYVVEKALIGHIAIVISRSREGRRDAIEFVVVVVLLAVDVFVLVQRVAPLEAAPDGKVRIRVQIQRQVVVG